MAGILYGVGVGPGDPELMTLKAVRLIKECDWIGIPAKDPASCTAYQIAASAIPQIAEKSVAAVPVPMTRDAKRLEEAYREGSKRLASILSAGQSIAFLNLGDPTVYGSYMELHKRILAAGLEAKVISGVPSFCAVAAALDLPLGDGNEMIHILPGRYGAAELDTMKGTKILMKSASRVADIKEALCRLQAESGCIVRAVSNCGMKTEAICENIDELPEDAGYFTTILVKE